MGRYKDEIVSVRVRLKNGVDELMSEDEDPRPGTTIHTICNLQPVFKLNGVITAGNAAVLLFLYYILSMQHFILLLANGSLARFYAVTVFHNFNHFQFPLRFLVFGA